MSAVAESIPTEMPAPILFTDSAAAKVADLIAEEGNPISNCVYLFKAAAAPASSTVSRLTKSPMKMTRP